MSEWPHHRQLLYPLLKIRMTTPAVECHMATGGVNFLLSPTTTTTMEGGVNFLLSPTRPFGPPIERGEASAARSVAKMASKMSAFSRAKHNNHEDPDHQNRTRPRARYVLALVRCARPHCHRATKNFTMARAEQTAEIAIAKKLRRPPARIIGPRVPPPFTWVGNRARPPIVFIARCR